MAAVVELFAAAARNDLGKVTELVSDGVDVNSRNSISGDTVLHHAARFSEKPVIDFLARLPQMHPSLENYEKETALDIAKDRKCWEGIGEGVLRWVSGYKNCGESSGIQYNAVHPDSANRTAIEATLENMSHQQEMDKVLNFLASPWLDSKKQKPVLVVRLKEESTTKLSIACDEKEVCFNNVSTIDVDAEFTIDVLIFCSSNVIDTPIVSSTRRSTANGSENHQVIEVTTADPDTFCAVFLYFLKSTWGEWQKNKGKYRQEKDLFNNAVKEIIRIEDGGTNFLEFGRQLFANIINEINKTNKKIKFCTEKLFTPHNCPASFTKKACVGLFWFLETFSFQDTYYLIKMNTKEVEVKEGTVDDDMKKMKKTYFMKYFPKGNYSVNECYACIQNFRNFLIHNTRMIEPADFSQFVTGTGERVNELLSDLNKFALVVQDNICGTEVDSSDDVGDKILNYFRKFKKKGDNEGWSGSIEFDEVLKRFSSSVARLVGQKEIVDPEEVLFDLYFNINPRLEKRTLESKRLVELRKVTSHAFHEVKPGDLKHQLSFAIPEVYKECLAKEIHQVICNFELDEDHLKMKELLSAALLGVTEKFEKYDYMKLLPLFEGERFSRMTHDSNDKNLSRWPDATTVQSYLKYMAPLIDSHTGNVSDDRHVNNQKDKMQVAYGEVELLETFQAFLSLHQALETNSELQPKRLIDCLRSDLGISRDEAENVVNVVLSKDVKVSHDLEYAVNDTLRTLSNIFRSRRLSAHQILDQHAILLYNTFMEDNLNFSFEDQASQLKKLNDEEQSIIRKTLAELQEKHEMFGKIQFGGRNFIVTVHSVVVNIMKLSLREYKLHQVGYETVEEMFNDDSFVTFLINRDVQLSDAGVYEVKDSNLLIKNVLVIKKLDFTNPYIASLIIRVQNARAVRYADLQKLVKLLLQCDRHMDKFIALLNVKEEKVTKAIVNTIILTDIPREKFCGILRALMDGMVLKQSCEEWLDLLKKKSIRNPEGWLRSFFSSSNKVAREYERQNNFLDARKFLTIIEAFQEQLVRFKLYEEDAGLTVLLLIRKAQLEASEGYWWLKLCEDWGQGNKKNNEFNEKALQYLDKDLKGMQVPEEEYMLFLSLKSMVLGVLRKENVENAKKSLEIRTQLWNRMWKYISGETVDAPPFLKVYEVAKTKENYQSLLQRGEEFRYLEVCRMYNSVLKCRYFVMHGSTAHADIESMLSLLPEWSKIRDVRIREAEETKDEFKLLLANLTLKEMAKVHSAVAKCFHSTENLDKARFHLYKSLELNVIRYEAFKEIFGRCDDNTQSALNDVQNSHKYFLWKSKEMKSQLNSRQQQEAVRGSHYSRSWGGQHHYRRGAGAAGLRQEHQERWRDPKQTRGSVSQLRTGQRGTRCGTAELRSREWQHPGTAGVDAVSSQDSQRQPSPANDPS